MSIKDLLNAEATTVKASPVKLVVNDMKFLSSPCEKASVVEAEAIWPVLEATLDTVDGYGLAANQIGIQKCVGVIRYKGETYRLLNPRIIDTDGDKIFIKDEGCLSFPGKSCNTLRYTDITVEDDNLGRVGITVEMDDLLPIIFQHEIDHLNGCSIFDNKPQPRHRSAPKVGRNDLCPCNSGKKYKKCCLK